MTTQASTGNAELKIETRLEIFLARMARTRCFANSRAQTAKARASVPATRNFAMPLMNCSVMPEMRPPKWDTSRKILTCNQPQNVNTTKEQNTNAAAIRAKRQL